MLLHGRMEKTPARKRGWGSLIEHGGDLCPTNEYEPIPSTSDRSHYKLVMITGNVSRGRMLVVVFEMFAVSRASLATTRY